MGAALMVSSAAPTSRPTRPRSIGSLSSPWMSTFMASLRGRRRLAVKPHEVVRTQDPRNGWPTLQTAVRAMPVVMMEPLGELSAPLVGVPIKARVGPLQQGGFDEALDLAIGP